MLVYGDIHCQEIDRQFIQSFLVTSSLQLLLFGFRVHCLLYCTSAHCTKSDGMEILLHTNLQHKILPDIGVVQCYCENVKAEVLNNI